MHIGYTSGKVMTVKSIAAEKEKNNDDDKLHTVLAPNRLHAGVLAIFITLI